MRAAIVSWLLAAPMLALAWPLAWDIAGGAGPPAALLVARQGVSLLMRGASAVVGDASRGRIHRADRTSGGLPPPETPALRRARRG